MCLLHSPRLPSDVTVLYAGVVTETDWWFCSWQQQHWIYQAAHVADSGEELKEIIKMQYIKKGGKAVAVKPFM